MNRRLKDLKPRWVRYGGKGVRDAQGKKVLLRSQVGVSFDCPCDCGTRVFIPFLNPPDGKGPYDPKNPGWTLDGDSFDDMTLSPSILRRDSCGWHGFVTNGEIVEA